MYTVSGHNSGGRIVQCSIIHCICNLKSSKLKTSNFVMFCVFIMTCPSWRSKNSIVENTKQKVNATHDLTNLRCDRMCVLNNIKTRKADFHSVRNVVRSMFSKRFLLKCVKSTTANEICSV